MKILCLVALLLGLPLAASAQTTTRSDTRADTRSGGRSNDRQNARPNDRAHWWEQKQTPWWEQRQPTQWWHVNNPVKTMNSSRQMLDEMREDRQRKDAGGRDTRQHRRNNGPSVIYVVPQYRYFPYTLPASTQYGVTPPPPAQVAPVVTQREAESPPAPMGLLRLDVEPRESLQIFVDGVFVGTPVDLGDELMMLAGTRRIELRARGYKTLSFNVEITESRSLTYKGTLERDENAPPPSPPPVMRPAPAPGSRTMYMIPGCYLGNVEPRAENLRPGCDLSKLTTVKF